MAGFPKLGGHCPLCRETGREGRLELRQINASEALWICGNLQCPYPVYLDVLTVFSVVPELLAPGGSTTLNQTQTSGDHSWRRLAASADQSDQMAAAAFSYQDYSLATNGAYPHPSMSPAVTMETGFGLTPMEPENLLDELSALFEDTSNFLVPFH